MFKMLISWPFYLASFYTTSVCPYLDKNTIVTHSGINNISKYNKVSGLTAS